MLIVIVGQYWKTKTSIITIKSIPENKPANFMKKKTINLFIVIILLGQYLYAQSNYNSGYIITTKNDTINGFILSKIDSELAYKINFKKKLSDKTIAEYNTRQLLSFGFSSGRIFKRMRVTTNNKATKDSSYVFAKRIVEGKIDLYVWRHKQINSKDFFILNNKSERKAQLTKPEKKEIKLDGKTFSKKIDRYKNYIIYVKEDENFKPKKNNKLRFGEKSIIKDIISFNRNFQDEYPIKEYREPVAYTYDILVGIPFQSKAEGSHFRVGVYRNKTFIDKSNKYSFLSGIIYLHWSNNNKEWNNQYETGTSNYRWQMLNLIPAGIKFQANSSRIIPYVYLGVGAAVLMRTNYIIEDYENVGSKNELGFLPTVNLGVGAKIKVGSNFILTEITPTYNGIFFNAGYSF